MNKKLKKYIGSLTVLIVFLSITLLTILGLEMMFYFYLLVLGLILGYYILKGTKFFKFSYLLFTSFFWETGTIILISGVIAMFSIPLNLFILFLPILLIVPLLILYPISIEKTLFLFDKWELLLALFLIFSSISSPLFLLFLILLLKYRFVYFFIIALLILAGVLLIYGFSVLDMISIFIIGPLVAISFGCGVYKGVPDKFYFLGYKG